LLIFAAFAATTMSAGLTAPLAHADGLCTATCYVATTGSDTLGDGQQASPFLTVQKAVDTVQAGGTVIVGAGTFTEQVTISQAMTLEGDGAANTTIQMPNPTYGDPASIIVNAGTNDLVTINDVTVSTNNVCGTAIDIEGGNTNIYDNVIDAPNPNGLCVSTGIYQDAGNSTISSNTISGYQGAGVWVDGSAVASVSSNVITGGPSNLGQQAGVIFDGAASGSITSNTISGNKCIQSTYPPPNQDQNTCEYDLEFPQMAQGISIDTTGNVTVTGNRLSNNDIGIAAYEGGTLGISNNIITSTYVGLMAMASSMTFDTNSVSGGQYGIVMVSFPPSPPPYPSTPAPGLTGTGNTIIGNGTGVYVFKYGNDTTAPDPFITLNRNAINSNTTGYNNTSGVTQDATCNWWGDASGPSGVGGGTGDTVSANMTFSPWLTGSDLANSPCDGTASGAPTTTTATAVYYDLVSGPVVAITAHVDSSNSGIYDESGTGTVSFYNGGTLLCTVPLEYGKALCESAIAPATSGPHSLTVVYNGTAQFLSSSTTTDVVTAVAQPTLVSAAPVTPNTGMAWLVKGGGFSGATSVTVCGIPVPFTVINDYTLLVGVPAVTAPQQCTITVTAAGGTGSSTGTVTVVPKPQPGAPVVVFPTGPVTPPPTQSCGATSTVTISNLWTLVAWPGASGTPVDAALAGGADHCGTNVTSQVAVVWGFDASTQKYHAFFPAAANIPGANDLASLTQGLGYWVALHDSSANVTWTVETA
jgi:hypothetical protein